jgi:AraC-like DNA-binding protein
MPLTDYINSKRLQRAAVLLQSTGANIEEIADQCGFLDPNYFARLFKRKYGKTPGEYRKSLRLGV